MKIYVNESYGKPIYPDAVPCDGVRVYYDCGPASTSAAKAAHVRRLMGAGVEVLPQLHNTGVVGDENTSPAEAYAVCVERFLAVQPHFPIVEIGNEPLKPPPAGQPSWQDYLGQLERGSRLVRAAGSKAMLCSAVRAQLVDFLNFFDANGSWATVDAVAIHPYASDAAQMVDLVRACREVVPERLPLWVTEFGWATWRSRTEAQQAQLLEDGVRALRAVSVELGVHAACWFCWRDGEQVDEYFQNTGLLRRDNTHKPSYRRLRDLWRQRS